MTEEEAPEEHWQWRDAPRGASTNFTKQPDRKDEGPDVREEWEVPCR